METNGFYIKEFVAVALSEYLNNMEPRSIAKFVGKYSNSFIYKISSGYFFIQTIEAITIYSSI